MLHPNGCSLSCRHLGYAVKAYFPRASLTVKTCFISLAPGSWERRGAELDL
jgi:hypothetical protein